MASAAAMVVVPSCCTSASSMATAFVSAPAAAAALSDRMRISLPSLPSGLARSPCSRGITSGSTDRIEGGISASGPWLSRHSGHDPCGVYRSPPPTALYSIRRDLFSPAYSKSQPTARSWSSISTPEPDDLCFSNRLAGAHDDLPPRSCRRRRRSTRLAGLRKPRDADDPTSANENFDRKDEGEGAPRKTSGETKGYASSSVPASKRGPPEDDDIWSKHSVFEFKSLNDPDTNACGYKGLSGQPRAPYSSSPSTQGPAPELRLTSSQQPRASFDGVDELLEAERPADAPGVDADFFKFREKEALASVERRQEVERRRRNGSGGRGGGGGGRRGGAGGGGDDGSAVKVDLATQLGLPATATYDELRTAYRVEIKRCHPDLAGDNDFRVKFLERKFLKLQGCWDEFSAGHAAGATTPSTKAQAGAPDNAGGGSSQAARGRARARAQEEARQQQAAAVAAAAAAQRSRRPVMDPGRKVMDPGNTSSC